MKRTKIEDLKPGKKKILIKAWVQETRVLSKVIFLILRDVTGLVQAVVKESDEELFNQCKSLNRESIIVLEGKVKKNKQAMNGLEIHADNIKVISESDTPLPIPVVEKGVTTGLSKRLDWRHLDLRKEENLLVMKVSTVLEKGFRKYWNDKGFIQIHSPKLIGTASESGSEVFMLPYFGREAFLAQSPQFYKQMAMTSGFEKVFEIGPAFRAEKSHTSRHLTEYTSVDMEFSFIKDHYDIMKELEALIRTGLKQVKEELGKEVKEKFKISINIPKKEFPKISFKKAHEVIKKITGEIEDPNDLTSKDEELLGEWAKKEHESDFLFITDYPWGKRPFYHMKNDSGETTKSFDLLYKGLEIVTGSQREHRYEILKKQAENKGLNLKPLTSYLNFFKYACPPHGGMGMGLSRVVKQLLELENIREATYLPRDTDRLTP